MSTPLGEMYMFTVDSDELSIVERRYLLDWVIRPALRTVSGVADVNALGGKVKTYSISPRSDAMLALGVTTGDLVQALESNNQNDGAGRLQRGEEALLVRSEGAFVGIGLLALYYLAHPSFPWLTEVNVEGSYWFVNKNLIELAACLVIYQLPTGRYFGLERIFSKNKTAIKIEEV